MDLKELQKDLHEHLDVFKKSYEDMVEVLKEKICNIICHDLPRDDEPKDPPAAP
ncbi:MAG TPA: hypothetical protein PL000_07115 [Anaerolineales bacterium]|nr:hypothetical protein [Anaerolineales bacterium]